MAIGISVTEFFATRHGRILKENFTAYAFLAPAAILIGLFGLFPVAFAFFVSLHRWRRFPDHYSGLANYEKALGNLAFILFFWLALLMLMAGLLLIRRLRGRLSDSGQVSDVAQIAFGVFFGYCILLVVDWFFKLIPIVMVIPRQVRGQNTSLALFMEKLGESFLRAEVLLAGNTMLVALLLSISIAAILVWRFPNQLKGPIIAYSIGTCIAMIGGVFLLQLTLVEIEAALSAARESGEALPIWSPAGLHHLRGQLAGIGLVDISARHQGYR